MNILLSTMDTFLSKHLCINFLGSLEFCERIMLLDKQEIER